MNDCFEAAVKKFTRTVDGKTVAPVFTADVKREFNAMNIPFDNPAYKLAADAGKAAGDRHAAAVHRRRHQRERLQ